LEPVKKDPFRAVRNGGGKNITWLKWGQEKGRTRRILGPRGVKGKPLRGKNKTKKIEVCTWGR